MRINNWCRKLSSTLVAGGLLMPCAAQAANLGVNLVTNGNFENVDLAVTGEYRAPKVLNWTGPNLFAYSHDGSSSSAGVVPDYADGADPPSAGHWYFTNNNTGGASFTDVRLPDVYYQDIDVSTGGTATAIAAGNATYALSAYFSSYLNDNDAGNVLADFKNSGGGSLGTALITDTDHGPANVWSLETANGIVPIGTATVRLSLYGTHGGTGGGGADGYTDNVEFIIRGVPEPSSLALAGLGFAAAGLRARRRRDDS